MTLDQGLNKMYRDAQSTFGSIYVNQHPAPYQTMTRLLTFNEWTIVLEGDSLMAFNSNGNTVRSTEGKLCLDGTAFLYKNRLMWKGKLTQVLTEPNIADAKANTIHEARLRRNEAIQKKIIIKLQKGLK